MRPKAADLTCYKMKLLKAINDGKSLLAMMKEGYQYTFNELTELCGLKSTELCCAILCLIRDGKINQERMTDVVYQVVPARF